MLHELVQSWHDMSFTFFYHQHTSSLSQCVDSLDSELLSWLFDLASIRREKDTVSIGMAEQFLSPGSSLTSHQIQVEIQTNQPENLKIAWDHPQTEISV